MIIKYLTLKKKWKVVQYRESVPILDHAVPDIEPCGSISKNPTQTTSRYWTIFCFFLNVRY